jgi:hypothetical protein
MHSNSGRVDPDGGADLLRMRVGAVLREIERAKTERLAGPAHSARVKLAAVHGAKRLRAQADAERRGNSR